MATSSAGLFSVAGAVFLRNSLWGWLPSWQAAAPASQREIRVQSPVSDSVIASVDCKCHCQDNLLAIAAAFVTGLISALALVVCVRVWCQRRPPVVFAPELAEEPIASRPRLAIKEEEEVVLQRRKAVTPSTRR